MHMHHEKQVTLLYVVQQFSSPSRPRMQPRQQRSTARGSAARSTPPAHGSIRGENAVRPPQMKSPERIQRGRRLRAGCPLPK